MKKMKRKKVYGKKFICFICAIAMLLTVCNVKDTVDAAVKVGKPKKLTCQFRDEKGIEPYYKYNQASDPAILGDVASVEIKWSSVDKADGYRVQLFFFNDGEERTKDTVYVTKKNGKYIMTLKHPWHSIHSVGKKVKKHTDYGDYTTRLHGTHKGNKSFCQSKSLRFVTLFGTSEFVEKVTVQAYRNVGGKKVYGKSVSKKFKGWD